MVDLGLEAERRGLEWILIWEAEMESKDSALLGVNDCKYALSLHT